MLKNAASFVLGPLPCSRTSRTLCAPPALRPCWTSLFEHSLGDLVAFHRVDQGQMKKEIVELFNRLCEEAKSEGIS